MCPSASHIGSVHKCRWIAKLASLGLQPEIVVLQTFDSGDGLDTAERQWIAIGRAALRKRLTNITDGGDGVSGLAHSAEARAKMSAAKKAAWNDPEKRERMRTAQSRGKSTASARAANRERAIRQMSDPAMRQHLSNATRAAFNDPDKRKRMLDAKNAAYATPEYKAKRRRASAEIWSRQEVNDKKRATMVARGLWRA